VENKERGPAAPWQGPQEHKKQTTEQIKYEPRKADNLFATKADSSICSQQV
jgi:hypothetical protein